MAALDYFVKLVAIRAWLIFVISCVLTLLIIHHKKIKKKRPARKIKEAPAKKKVQRRKTETTIIRITSV